MENKYDSTVSDSMEESISKATEIFLQELEASKPKITRPGISAKKLLFPHILTVVFLLLFAAAAFILIRNGTVPQKSYIAVIAVIVLVFIIRIKRFLIDLILIYQQYAPESIRDSCLFTPTCSEYMLLSLKKYGVIVGLFKGIGRLIRCHPPNGGEDYP